MEVGKEEIIYLSLHCHHQNDSCMKMGSSESRFNVSLIVRDKSQEVYMDVKPQDRKRKDVRTEIILAIILSSRA